MKRRIPTSDIALKSLLQMADKELYQAKSQGRNRVSACNLITHVDCLKMQLEQDQTTISPVQLVWQDSLTSGNQLIDSQHQALFERANELIKAILEAHPKYLIYSIVTRLLDDIEQHFHDEEQILTSIKYTNLEQHILEHATLHKKAVELTQSFVNETMPLDIVVDFLICDLVQQHLLVADREFFPYTNEMWITIDINLPGIDGIGSTRYIRVSKADSTVPIIAITTYAMRGDSKKIMEASCNGYFEKPFDSMTGF